MLLYICELTLNKKCKMNKGKTFSFVLLLFLLLGCSSSSNVIDIKEISAAELKAEMKANPQLLILDVRKPNELTGEYGQIDSVVNIPVESLEQRIDELNKYKNNYIAVICRSGNRSKKATALLTNNGFNVTNVVGGMKAYDITD